MRIKRRLALGFYYLIARHFPTPPVPGYKIGYQLRAYLARSIFEQCGNDVRIKRNAYFGTGEGVRIGDRSEIGAHSRIDKNVTLGSDVVMGPWVEIMTHSHRFEDPNITIREQGGTGPSPVVVGNDVWLGTRVLIMPGVTIGDGCVVGANSVVTKDIPPFCVAVGSPARVIRQRGDRLASQEQGQ